MKTCFIFGALPVRRITVIPSPGDYIIAADKGIENLQKIGLEPDIVIGDFDSLGYVPENENKIVLPVRKDDTDIAHAVRYAIENGCDKFYVYGAIGGLLDHTMANIQIASYISKQGMLGEFIGDDFTVCCLTNGKLCLDRASNGRFSMFALDSAKGVTLKGLSYTAENRDFDQFYPIGVSNEFIGEAAEVEVKDGTLLLMWEGDAQASLKSSESEKFST